MIVYQNQVLYPGDVLYWNDSYGYRLAMVLESGKLCVGPNTPLNFEVEQLINGWIKLETSGIISLVVTY